MFVVDSSVWIDFYAGRPGVPVEQLDRAIRSGTAVAVCGPILQEVLQGIRGEAEFGREWKHLTRFIVLETTPWTFLRAASLYRLLRGKGVRGSPFDATIAAVCLEYYLPLLTAHRREFEPIARYAGLTLA